MKYNSMDPDNYHGVTIAMKLMTHKTGRSWYKPTYVIRFGDLMIEVDEATAVKLGDDLLDKASQVNDPESKFNENLRACFNPVTGTMTWPPPHCFNPVTGTMTWPMPHQNCPCTCFECSIDRHDICRHVIKCVKRPKVEK